MSCIDPFRPDFSGSGDQSLLVVDGLVTNENKAHSVTLSRSIATEELKEVNNYEAVSGAVVHVVDNFDQKFQLTESAIGFYITDPDQFQAKVGNSYQLTIQLEGGEVYQSDFQQMVEVSPINEVEIRQESEPVIKGGIPLPTDMLNLYAQSDPVGESIYYRFNYEGTYAAFSDYQGSTICWPNAENAPEDIPPTLICYRSEIVNLPLNVFSTEDQVGASKEKIINEIVDRRFALGYSMLLKKYSMTETQYEFSLQVKEQRQFGGSLFDPPPTEIVGNVRKVDESDNKALGFFSVSAVTTKRIFIDNITVQSTAVEPECFYDPDLYPISKPAEYCCDCRLFPGATDQIPEFWGD